MTRRGSRGLVTLGIVSLTVAPCLAGAQTPKPAKAATPSAAKPAKPAAAAPAPAAGSGPAQASAAAPGTPGASVTPPNAGAVANPCDYIDPAEAGPVVGAEATMTTAPSRGAFVSCGYTSPAGDALTLYISDYGLAQVAQQFFERNRDSLKTAAPDETFGVPAFTHRTAEQPFTVTFGAVKGTRTLLLEATGPLATTPQNAAHLHAIFEKAIAKLPADEPPPAPPQD